MSLTDTAERPVARDFFRPRRLGHTNLFVGDYLAAQQFYYKVAGFNEAYRQPDNLASFVSNGNSYHDLTLVDVHSHYNHDHAKPGMNHIAFELETEVDLAAGYQRALAAGYEFRTADHDVAHSLYTEDPDGNGVEFYADVVKNWRAVRSGIIVKEKPKYVPGVSSPANPERNYPQNPVIEIVPEAMFHSRRCSHVFLVTQRFEAMFAYYRDIAGLRPFIGDADSSVAILAGTHSLGDVTLMRRRGALATGMHHFGLEVRDESDLASGAKAAAAAGLTIVREVDHPARRTVCLQDPDGLLLQFHVNRDFRPETVAGVDEETALYLL
jgi:catechol 2,3-dioxygenase